MSDYFICLSMLVSGVRGGIVKSFGYMDALAYAIERENDPVDLPPLVQQAVDLFQRIQQKRTPR